MKIAKLQKELEQIYRLNPNPSVEKFLISSEEAKSYVPDQQAPLPQVLLKEENGVISFAVHVGDEALKEIEEEGLENAELGHFLSVAEEVSHFTYLAWSAQNEKQVSLLDVELQGEIDKFLLSSLHFEKGERLFDALFENVIFHSQDDPDVLSRYMEANRLAGKFCQALGDFTESLSWLREFYRLTPQARRKAIQKDLVIVRPL